MMMRPLERLVDLWIGRSRITDPKALEQTETRLPAAVITGGSAGIGAAIAAEFARRGTHAIILVARQEETLAETAQRIASAFSVRVEIISLDLTRDDGTEHLLAFASERGLYVDYLIANAGIGLAGPFHDQDEARIRALLDLNVTSLTMLMRAVLPGMLARGRGGILTLASLGGYVPGPHQAIYYASKAYVLSLTEAVSEEVKGRGVRIAVSAPGPVATSLHDTMGASSALYRELIPTSSPERVARRSVRGFMLGRTVIVPGIVETLLAWVVRIMPHALTVPLVGLLLRRREGLRSKK